MSKEECLVNINGALLRGTLTDTELDFGFTGKQSLATVEGYLPGGASWKWRGPLDQVKTIEPPPADNALVRTWSEETGKVSFWQLGDNERWSTIDDNENREWDYVRSLPHRIYFPEDGEH